MMKYDSPNILLSERGANQKREVEKRDQWWVFTIGANLLQV